MPETNLRFAVIGCGRIAERHVQQIKLFGCLTAVCDIVSAKADAFAAAQQAKAFYTTELLLLQKQSIDIIVVCTPNGLHAFNSIDALNANFHVLCEKPMAIKTDDCKRMIAAAEKNKKRAHKRTDTNPKTIIRRR